jgi:predicted Zn-dependent protease
MRRSHLLTAACALLAAAQPVLAQAAEAQAAAQTDGPQDALEQGLWMQMDEAERDLKTSQLVIHDPALNGYVRSVLCRTVGEAACAPVRLYLVHTPQFNATSAPNGAMQIWSGLLLRTQNEAQLAAVLAHEFAHFQDRHTVKLFRAAKSKSNAAAWLAFTGIGLIASIGLLRSIFAYSREMEQEADLAGVKKMAAAGYDAREAAVIWEQLRDEMDATAAARGTKSRKDKTGGLFATHPPSAERVAYLTKAATVTPGTPGATRAEPYRAAMAAWWPVFVDDQMKMNDFGATEYLLDSIAKSGGWTPWLNYARAELYRRRAGAGDLERAVAFYSQGIDAGASLPELWRGRGLALLKLGRAGDGRRDLEAYLGHAPNAADRQLITMMAGETT